MFVPFLESATGGGSPMAQSVLIIVLLIAVFYFMLIRPESKRKKNMQKMYSELTIGDTVTTIGGITGKLCSIDNEEIVIETGADRVRIQMMKWAISNRGMQTEQTRR